MPNTTAVQTSPSSANGGGDGSVTALSDNLARCQRQLGDWTACPSGKTPEGKRIIEALKTRITTLESRIQSQSKPEHDTAAPSKVASAAQATRPTMDFLGSVLNVYA